MIKIRIEEDGEVVREFWVAGMCGDYEVRTFPALDRDSCDWELLYRIAIVKICEGVEPRYMPRYYGYDRCRLNDTPLENSEDIAP